MPVSGTSNLTGTMSWANVKTNLDAWRTFLNAGSVIGDFDDGELEYQNFFRPTITGFPNNSFLGQSQQLYWRHLRNAEIAPSSTRSDPARPKRVNSLKNTSSIGMPEHRVQSWCKSATGSKRQARLVTRFHLPGKASWIQASQFGRWRRWSGCWAPSPA